MIQHKTFCTACSRNSAEQRALSVGASLTGNSGSNAWKNLKLWTLLISIPLLQFVSPSLTESKDFTETTTKSQKDQPEKSSNQPALQGLAEVTTKSLVGQSGAHYTILWQNDCKASWTTQRPKVEKHIKLCIPAAFTAGDGSVVGLYAINGKFHNQNKRDSSIGGVLAIIDGKCRIVGASDGNIDIKLLKEVLQKKGDLFQQFQVVANSTAEKFRDSSRFQRRGIATYKNGACAVIESLESITLSRFGQDLAKMGVDQFAYTDMGPWDEGWYRDSKSGRIKIIGRDRSLTYRQSNWLVFESNVQTAPPIKEAAKQK